MLYRLAVKTGPGCQLVEIGSYLGATSRWLAAAASQRQGRLYCIDTWQNQGMTEGPRDTHAVFLENTRENRPWITELRGWSHEMAAEVPGEVDLVFIDGDHSYESVSADVRLWLPRLKAGGWVVLHDTGWAEGVRLVIQDEVLPVLAGKPTVFPNMYAARIRSARRSA